MQHETAIGIDIGGSHITAARVNLSTRTIEKDSVKRIRVNSKGSVDEIIQTWSTVIDQLMDENNCEDQKIGIAMPGPFDYAEGISLMKDNDKYASLFGLNVKVLLAEKIKMNADGIFFMNDAAAFLKGELFAGAAVGYKRAIGLTLGTGLGTSAFDGTTARDANLWCALFADGIAEDYLSTRWFINRYEKLTGKKVEGVKEIADLYQTDKTASGLFNEFALNLADFLQAFITAENPEVIVIGGNIMQAEELFIPLVKQQLQLKKIDVPIVRAKLGEDAAILGAAALVWENEQIESNKI
jgi:glucokinase